MVPRPSARRLGSIAAVGLLTLTVSSCADDAPEQSGSSTPPASDVATSTPTTTTETPDVPTTVLDEQALTDLLLTVDDVPDGFAETTSDEDQTAATGTCLDDIANFDDRPDVQAESEAKVEFTAESDAGESQVTSAVESYLDAQSAAAAVDAFLEVAQACTTAQGTDGDGITYDLTLQTTDQTVLDGADRQVTVATSGTLSTQGQTFAVAYGFVVATAANNLVAVGASDFGEAAQVAEQAEPLAQAQLDRITGLR